MSNIVEFPRDRYLSPEGRESLRELSIALGTWQPGATAEVVEFTDYRHPVEDYYERVRRLHELRNKAMRPPSPDWERADYLEALLIEARREHSRERQRRQRQRRERSRRRAAALLDAPA